MTLILAEKDVSRVIKPDDMSFMAEVIQLMDDAYKEMGMGRVGLHQRVTVQYPMGSGYYEGRFLRFLPSIIPALGGAAVRVYSGHREGKNNLDEKRPDFIHGNETLLFYDYNHQMKLAAIINDRSLHEVRTGAPTGLATQYLAKRDASRVGLFGTGRQAGGQLRAVCAVRDIRTIRVFSPTKAHREGFAGRFTEELRIPVRAVGDAKEVVEGSDIVICSTNAGKPVFKGEWVQSGTHINSLSRGEIDRRTVQMCLPIVAAWTEQVLDDTPAREPYSSMIREGSFTRNDMVELADVVSGKVVVRDNDKRVTMFQSAGFGLWDSIIARAIYDKAIRAGAGIEMDLSGL